MILKDAGRLVDGQCTSPACDTRMPNPTGWRTDMDTRIDFEALKGRQQAAWGSGDHAVIGTTLQIVREQLAEACDLRTDERLLDVAAGNGNATPAAARRGCLVASTDSVLIPALPRQSNTIQKAWT